MQNFHRLFNFSVLDCFFTRIVMQMQRLKVVIAIVELNPCITWNTWIHRRRRFNHSTNSFHRFKNMLMSHDNRVWKINIFKFVDWSNLATKIMRKISSMSFRISLFCEEEKAKILNIMYFANEIIIKEIVWLFRLYATLRVTESSSPSKGEQNAQKQMSAFYWGYYFSYYIKWFYSPQITLVEYLNIFIW